MARIVITFKDEQEVEARVLDFYGAIISARIKQRLHATAQIRF